MQPTFLRADHQDINGARHWMSDICGPHSLHASQPTKITFTHTGHRLGSLATTLGQVQYGTDVTIGLDSQNSLNSYSLSLPLTGQQELRKDGQALLSDPHLGLIISPQENMQLSIAGDCHKIQIAITRQAMKSVAEQLLRRPLDAPICFDPLMDALHGHSAAWWRLVGFHLHELTASDALYRMPEVVHDIESALIKGLLLSQPNNYSDALRDAQQMRVPYYLKRARDFIEDNARDNVHLEDILHVAGISRFKLFEEFRQYYGCTPMKMLKNFRLQSVRRELLEDGGCSNVSAIALGWGFGHLGRFSNEYQQYFNELPSETLSRHSVRHS